MPTTPTSLVPEQFAIQVNFISLKKFPYIIISLLGVILKVWLFDEYKY